MAKTKVHRTKDINRALRSRIGKTKVIRIGGLKGHDCIAVGLEGSIQITVDGDGGDFFGALNRGATLILNGKCGRYLADSMLNGKVSVNGDAEPSAGFGMLGGTLLIKGNAGERVGAMMRSGTVIVHGDAADMAGFKMEGGNLIITGNAGKDIGLEMQGGSIYVGGEIEGFGQGAKIGEMTLGDKNMLNKMFDTYGIKTKIVVFEKVVPEMIETPDMPESAAPSEVEVDSEQEGG